MNPWAFLSDLVGWGAVAVVALVILLIIAAGCAAIFGLLRGARQGKQANTTNILGKKKP